MSDQRLSVTFGAFSCDVVGYDDPFAILTRVVELFGEIAKTNPAFGAGEVRMSDMERAKLVAGLSDQASRIEELADQSAPNGMRYLVTNADADTPEVAVETAADEDVAEEELIVAATSDEVVEGGDLELRDTLEAADAADHDLEEEVVALEIEPATSELAEPVAIVEELVVDEPATEAPLELTEKSETPVVVEAIDSSDMAQVAEPKIVEVAETESSVATAVEAAMQLHKAAQEETVVVDLKGADTAAPELADESNVEDIEDLIVAPAASLAEVEAEIPPVRQPLRLNISNDGVETAAQAKAPEAEKAEAAPEQQKRRVTITKLPLRPDPVETVEQPVALAKHSLTPVQNAEPVVTISPTIGASETDDPRISRAERIRAKLERRELEDDSENFLFSDVAEDRQEETAAEPEADDQQPLVLSPIFEEAEAPQEESQEEPIKKSRRSIANLLGFGKGAEDEPALADDVVVLNTPAPERAEDDYKGDTDGFDRLRESVATALPAKEEQAVSYAESKSQPETISEAIDYDDETSPTAFARRVGANSLQDLLEASAVYMDVVEGKSRFSRRDVMQALNQIGADKDYTQEARLKSFRKLLTTGSLVRVDDGMFTVSQATRFGYETRMQA